MPTEITQVNNGLTRIAWTTSILKEGVHSDGTFFHLGCFAYSPYLHITKLPTEAANEGTRQFKVWIGFTQVNSPVFCGQSISSGLRGILPSTAAYHSQNQPSAVWANINGGKNQFLTMFGPNKATSSSSWIQEKQSIITLDHSATMKTELESDKIDGFPFTLVCELWIKFITFSQSEKKALHQFSEMFDQQKYCDVQFCFKDGEGTEEQTIGGHLNILAIRSSVFAAMFEHDRKECKTGRVTIQDIHPKVFKQLLQFIYSGRTCELLTENTAQSLCVAADKYDIEDLKEECVDFLLSCIRMDNAIKLMVWAHLYSIKELKDAALAFAVENGQDICMQPDWEELTKTYPDLCVLATRRMMVHKFASSSST